MSLANLCTTIICIFFYMEILPFSEVINVRRTDVIVKNTHPFIFTEKSKTDVYQEGSRVYLNKRSSVLCAIRLST